MSLRAPGSRRRGVVLLAVLIFIALLLPLVTLVLTSINTEQVATAEAIKGTKADLAAEKALNDAISLVVQERHFPDYWTSARQSNTAIIVVDPRTGYRRDEVPDQGANGAAGADDLLGTDDDFWIGPRLNGSYNGNLDDEDSSRMYGFDIRFPTSDIPTYLGQGWSFSGSYSSEGRSPFTGQAIPFFNQYGAVAKDTDTPPDGVDGGYNLSLSDPFGGADAELFGPGYYLKSDEPRTGGPGTTVDRDLDAANGVEAYMYNAKVNIYESIFTDLDRGPIPSSLLKSYANVTDEAGRINLNLFCKKLRVYMPESSETDYDFDGAGTEDFNLNQSPDEWGWKWIDNPLFPDRQTTLRWNFDATTESFPNTFAATNGIIDFGGINAFGFFTGPDDASMPEIGENAQHLYTGDTDGDGISDGNEACRLSLQMLMALPGVTGDMAGKIMEYLNPSQDYFADLGAKNGGGANYYVPGGNWPPNGGTMDYTVSPPIKREDACNITPPLVAAEVRFTGGTVADFYWNMGDDARQTVGTYDPDNDDDLPLPPPRTLQTIDQLIDAGLTERQLDRLRDSVTVYSYDTNVIGSYIQDVPEDEDLVNAYQPGDWQFTGFGSTLRDTPQELQDTDDVPDLRFDVDRIVQASTMSEYRQSAEEMYANLRAHLPKTLLNKITLPAVDRMGRAGAEDNLVDNADAKYDPASSVGTNNIYVPHRDSDIRVYNVGALGRQDDPDGAGPAQPTNYPALNPEMTLDSCLSAVLYRNGAAFEEDDYTYDPSGNAWRASANPGFGNFFPFPGLVWLFRSFGPFSSFFNDLFEANNNPSSLTGNNVNPVIPAHGYNVLTPQNLLAAGSFDSTADLLNVPLYQFGRLSVSLMATPPSDYRADIDNDGSVDAGLPEQGNVDYYIAMSDVVDLGWYSANVDPAGPDGRMSTADDPNLDRVLYRINFTAANQPNVNYPAAWRLGQPVPGGGDNGTALINITARQLHAVGGGAASGKTQITIAAYNNANSQPFLGPDFFSRLSYNFSWRDVPYPEERAAGGSIVGFRPIGGGAWQAAPAASWRQAWAYDDNGDPYITGRVQVTKWDPTTNAPAQPQSRSDEIVKVYLQNNVAADIPFKVQILPVRLTGDEWEIRSAMGGAEGGNNGQFVLYDWSYGSGNTFDWPPALDLPGGYDGVWPATPGQPGQANDPRVIRIRPNQDATTPGQTAIVLRAYDLRSFTDPGGGWAPAIPIATGYPLLDTRMWTGGRVTHAPVADQFPSAAGYPAGPNPATPGYAQDKEQVEGVESQTQMKSEVTVEEPSIYVDDTDVRIRVGAAGGVLPYTYRVRILDGGFGEPGATNSPYLGPDGVGPIANFPGITTPPRPSRVDAPLNNARAYDTTGVAAQAVWRQRTIAGSNSVNETFFFRPGSASAGAEDINGKGALTVGDYWVEVQVIDSTGAPITDYSYTKLTVGTNRSPGGSAGTPPEMNSSINLRELGDNRIGFVGSVSVDGGAGGYSYYWEVRKPVYGGDPSSPVIVSDETARGRVGGSGTNSFLTSNEANPIFEFDASNFSATGEGVYFVHCYVLDANNALPGVAAAAVAHDVAMVTLYSDGTLSSGVPSTSSLARTPMALLAANPPGNSAAIVATNSTGASGSDRPSIGTAANVTDAAVEPDIAANGDVIVIRGFNFAPLPEDNIVHFAGDVTAEAFDLLTRPEVALIGGNSFNQQELFVVVPKGATSGPLTVEKRGAGTSASFFFQTGFLVNFDLIGQISTNDAAFVRMDLDFQGDGRIDYSYNSTSSPSASGIARSSDLGISHDYAADGVGNYNATLTVTDLVSGRKQVSHQLVTIKDLRPLTNSILTIAGGTFDVVAGGTTVTDNEANFSSSGVQVNDAIVNVNNQSQRANITGILSDTQLTLSAAIGGVGTEYVIQRSMSGAQVNAMLTNIWPELDLRSETFTPTNDHPGTSFASATGGTIAAGLRYKWQIDDDGNRNNIGGELRTTGCVTLNDDTPNARVLHDDNANFINAGVKVGDLVIVTEDNPDSSANVIEVRGPHELLLGAPTNNAIGLTGGGGVIRQGTADNPPPATAPPDDTTLIDNLPTPYQFGGACPGIGGIVIGDTVQNVTDGFSGTVVTVANGQLTHTPFPPGANTLTGVAGPGSAGALLFLPLAQARQVGYGFTVQNVTTGAVGVCYVGLLNGGNPFLNTTGIVWVPGNQYQINLVNVAAQLVAGTDEDASGNSILDTVAPPSASLPNPAIRLGDPVRNVTDGFNSTVSGWAGAPSVPLVSTAANIQSNIGDLYEIDASGTTVGGLWDAGDIWRVQIPANRLRIGYRYEIYGANGTQVESRADAAYASLNALLDFDISLTFPFDLDPTPGRSTKIHVDWDGDGVLDNSYAVGQTTRSDGSANSLDIENVRVSHSFTTAELASRNASIPTYLSQAQFQVEVWERNHTVSRTMPSGSNWYQLPQVVINGDDYDSDLRTLNLNKWDNSTYHQVTLETQYGQTSFQSVGGLSVPTSRQFYATDTLLIPPGMEDYADTLTTWVSYSKPFIYSNGIGSTALRHQAVHGTGGALNWMSDANADTRSFFDPQNESPLGPNPVNFHEFIDPSGPNRLSPTATSTFGGASFPQVFPGAGRASGGSFVYFRGDRGIYNGFGFAADNLPGDHAAFSFDSQAMFLGDRVTGSDDEVRPLGADIFLNPLVATNSQNMQFTSFVTGSTSNVASFTYRWELEKIGESGTAGASPSGVGRVGMGGVYGIAALGNVSSSALNPIFNPVTDISDEPWYQAGGDGSGRYRIYLRAIDAGGNTAFSASREFDVEPIPLRVFIMADPPSASVSSEIQYHIYVDGGIGPYRVQLDTDNDGVYDIDQNLMGGNEITLSTVYDRPSVTANPPSNGFFTAHVHVTDSKGQPPQFAGTTADATTEVYIADTIPLNASMLVNPPSGVAPFAINVHYSVSGGSPLSGNKYNVTLQLINTDGGAQGAVNRDDATTLGADGRLDDPRRPNGDDDPVVFVVPEAGNYYVQLIATDNDGNVISKTEDVFAAGYTTPTQYGSDVPRVVRDGNNRPQHAFRVWVDPFLNIGNGTTNTWRNVPQGTGAGGRLMEGDLQVIGDAIMTDPNPCFRSPYIYATKDPAQQQKYLAQYELAALGDDRVQDFYDTYTIGRVNLNTASEDALTALFMRIVLTRAYEAHNDTVDVNGDGDTTDVGEQFTWVDLDNDNNIDLEGDRDGDGDFTADERMRNVRDYGNDIHISEGEARALARAVVKYRTAFYDAHKPTAPDAGSNFGYRQGNVNAAAAIQGEVGGTLRVDHLPVIGPWDGANPHEYAVTDRNAILQNANSGDLTNAWDNMAANYYNIDKGAGGEYMFYAPSDVAVVREPWKANVTIDVDGDGIDSEDFRFQTTEPPGNYAKYLNDVELNNAWGTNRPSTAWQPLNLYPFSNYYSKWSFDARNYFTYDGGEFDVSIRLPSGGGGPVINYAQTVPPGVPGDARNNIGVFESNGETAYGFIPNPPFRSVMDLYKVIDDDAWSAIFGNNVPNTFQLAGSQMELDADYRSTSSQQFSGPSVFMYSARWDEASAQFVPTRNMIDDIAPYCTCRSYVYRVEASGGVVTSSTGGADLESSRINRDRTRTAIIDVGKMNTGRTSEFGTKAGWQILWQKTSRD
jgi:hypothetical protein